MSRQNQTIGLMEEAVVDIEPVNAIADALPLWNLAKAELSGRLGEDKLRSTRKLMAELAEAAKTLRA